MDNKIRYVDVISRLEENKLTYEIVTLSKDVSLIVTALGGRAIGPFYKRGLSIGWLNEAFKSKSAFADFLKSKHWNIGAERMWVAPEFPFFNKQRSKFDETYTVQPEIDPGNHVLKVENTGVNLDLSVDVPVFEMPFERKAFHINRSICVAENPLKYLDQLKDIDVAYGGFNHHIMLEDTSIQNKMPLEPWVLSQINPGGHIIVPFMGAFEFVDYYDPIDDSIQKVYDGYVELKVCGDRKYKVAYKSAQTFGRAGYINKYDEENYYLIIKNYDNNPSNAYCCEPWHTTGEKGCSLYVYNDNGQNGGFAEFENSGFTTNENTPKVNNTFTQWFFIGKKSDMERIILALLGVTYKI
jgi:hypothetical protein